MKHGRHLRKLSRDSDSRRRLFKSLMRETLEHGAVVTSRAKAKAVQPQLEKLITSTKETGLDAFRRAIADLGDVESARLLVRYSEIFKTRPGGYTRIMRIKKSGGDNSDVVKIEFIERLPEEPKAEVVKKLDQKVAEVTPSTTEIKTQKMVRKPKIKTKTTK